jgi:hypothetical protein
MNGIYEPNVTKRKRLLKERFTYSNPNSITIPCVKANDEGQESSCKSAEIKEVEQCYRGHEKTTDGKRPNVLFVVRR